MPEFRIGDRVMRRTAPHGKIMVGDLGTVVSVARNNVRVRYDRHNPFTRDGCYGQLPANICQCVPDPADQELSLALNKAEEAAMVRMNEIMDGLHRPHMVVHANPVSTEASLLWKMARDEKWRDAERQLHLSPEHLIDAMRIAGMECTLRIDSCPLPHKPKTPIVPDLGMFVRDGMTAAEARLALANRTVEQYEKKRRVSPPKICATLPSKPKGKLHKAPRAWGWLNVKLGIGSSQHVQWEVAPPLDAFGREA